MEKLVLINVETVTGDPRQYNQQRQIFSPVSCTIGVSIEVNPENFVNISDWYEKHLLWELGQGEKPTELDENELVFTPLGWSRVMEKLEEPYNSSGESDQVRHLFEDEETDF